MLKQLCIAFDFNCKQAFGARILNSPINIDKMLRDIPLFTVFPSRGLAREFPDVSREQNLVGLFLELVPLITTRE